MPKHRPVGPAAANEGLTHRALALPVLLLLAVLVRWVAYTGFFGSDEVTYIEQSFKLLDGDWRVEDYVGANRFGMNLPTAALAVLLGRNELGAAAFPILCAVGEVALVWWVTLRMFGSRAAWFAGLLMAVLPSHVHFAGRIMADTPLTLTITASFVFFYLAEQRRWAVGYLLAGVFAGLSFWVKPVTLFVFAILLLWPLIARRWEWRWAWMVVGTALALAANGVLFWVLTDNFWFILEAMSERRGSGYLEEGIGSGDVNTAPTFYLSFLLLKTYHTGLVGWLALLGLVWLIVSPGRPAARAPSEAEPAPLAVRYLAFWALGLIAILSLLPVSLDPLLWIPKQTNYMLIFVAPLCVLGGLALARLGRRAAALAATAAVVVGLGFALLLQASVASFTANSWATLRFVDEHPAARVALMSNAYRAAIFRRLVDGVDVDARVGPLAAMVRSQAAPNPNPNPNPDPADTADRAYDFAVTDEESFDWDGSRPFARPGDVPACWVRHASLTGEPRGLGIALVSGLRVVAGVLPGSIGDRIEGRLTRLIQPRPAVVYRLPVDAC